MTKLTTSEKSGNNEIYFIEHFKVKHFRTKYDKKILSTIGNLIARQQFLTSNLRILNKKKIYAGNIN